MGKLTISEESGTPATPASGRAVLYPKADGKFYSKDDAGTEYKISIGAGDIGTAELADSAVTTAKIANGAVTADKIGINAVGEATLINGSVTAAKLAQRTRRVLVPATSGRITSSTDQPPASFAGIELASGDNRYAFGYWSVPSDFVSMTSVTAVVYSIGTSGNVRLDNGLYWSAVGESYINGSSNSGITTVAVTANQNQEVLQRTPSGLASGDYVRFYLLREGADPLDTMAAILYTIGWIVEYTSQ